MTLETRIFRLCLAKIPSRWRKVDFPCATLSSSGRSCVPRCRTRAPAVPHGCVALPKWGSPPQLDWSEEEGRTSGSLRKASARFLCWHHSIQRRELRSATQFFPCGSLGSQHSRAVVIPYAPRSLTVLSRGGPTYTCAEKRRIPRADFS